MLDAKENHNEKMSTTEPIRLVSLLWSAPRLPLTTDSERTPVHPDYVWMGNNRAPFSRMSVNEPSISAGCYTRSADNLAFSDSGGERDGAARRCEKAAFRILCEAFSRFLRILNAVEPR